jgi:single-strand DNA-binding protein
VKHMQRVELIGNLGADPELRYSPAGRAVTNFRVAVSRRWRDAEGQLQERIEWFRVTAWGRLAEVANERLAKGSPVYLAGRLQTRSFEGSDGTTRYLTELVANDLVILPHGDGQRPAGEESEVEEEEEGDELPL